MRRHLAVQILAALALGALGCAALSGIRNCPEEMAAARARGVETSCKVLRKPALLVDQAQAALKARNIETAYQYLALLHTLHPNSPEDHEQFRLAARIFVDSYFRHRVQFDSLWVKSEPTFMFEWLSEFFQEDAEFPQPQVEAMFIGMHYGMFRDFLAYAKNRPDISAWTITATKDNGIIESIQGRRAEPGETPARPTHGRPRTPTHAPAERVQRAAGEPGPRG